MCLILRVIRHNLASIVSAGRKIINFAIFYFGFDSLYKHDLLIDSHLFYPFLAISYLPYRPENQSSSLF